jgi:DivIVA domain-containing protein
MSTVAFVFLGAGLYVLAGWWLSGRFGSNRLEPEAVSDATSTSAFAEAADYGSGTQRIEFDTAVRGYRMDEVDRTVDALQQVIRTQAEEISRLRNPSVASTNAEVSPGQETSTS